MTSVKAYTRQWRQRAVGNILGMNRDLTLVRTVADPGIALDRSCFRCGPAVRGIVRRRLQYQVASAGF